MALNYKIRKFDIDFGQISVEYFSDDGLYSQEYSIDLPIKSDNTYPIGAELAAVIDNVAPNFNYERVVKINAGVSNASDIQNLVEPRPVVVPVQQIEEPAEENVPT